MKTVIVANFLSIVLVFQCCIGHVMGQVGKSYILPASFTDQKHFLFIDGPSACAVLHVLPDSVSESNQYLSVYWPTRGVSESVELPVERLGRRKLIRGNVDGNKLYLLSNNEVLVLKRKAQVWSVDTSIMLPFGVSGGSYHNGIFYVWDELIDGLRAEHSAMRILSVDCKARTVTLERALTAVKGWPLAYVQPRSVINRSKNYTAVNDITSYSIRLFNSSWIQQAEIQRFDIAEFNDSHDGIDTLDMSSDQQRTFPKLLDVSRSRATIVRSTLLNDSVLCVVWTMPDSSTQNTYRAKVYIDTWKRNGTTWEIDGMSKQIYPSTVGAPYSLEELVAWKDVRIESRGVVTFTAYSPKWPLSKSWTSYSSYQQDIDARAASDEDIRYVVSIHQPIPAYRLEQLNGVPVNLTLTPKQAVVFAGDYACSDCYKTIVRQLQKNDSSLAILCVVRTTTRSAQARRLRVKELKRLMDVDTFLFDYSPDDRELGTHQGGMFGKFNIRRTPAVLSADANGMVRYIPFGELFP